MEESGFFMSGFLEAAAKAAKFALRWDDDIYDRLSHRYTVMILVLFTILVSTKQYVGDPISCWCPATFTEPMIEYTNHICWISNTYFVPFEEMPDKSDVPRKEIVGYYQWIPLMLLLQALMFHTPSIVWSVNNNRPGYDINRMVLIMSGMEHINPEIRDKSIKFLCKHFDKALSYQREYRRSRYRRCLQSMAKHINFPIGRIYGNYLTWLYIFIKILYIVNSFGQLLLMNRFLARDKAAYYLYGIDVLISVFNNRQPDTRLFPRITLCDFKIRQMQNVQDHTLQCTLPINLFNEKIYIYLWFHIALVILLTIFGFVKLIWQLFSYNSASFVAKYLKITSNMNGERFMERRLVRGFITDYLRSDGVFCLRVISNNTNDVITAEVISELYSYYRKSKFYRTPKPLLDCYDEYPNNRPLGTEDGKNRRDGSNSLLLPSQ